MAEAKITTRPGEPQIALTVIDHEAQQGFQEFCFAGVAAAFREKHRARRENPSKSGSGPAPHNG